MILLISSPPTGFGFYGSSCGTFISGSLQNVSHKKRESCCSSGGVGVGLKNKNNTEHKTRQLFPTAAFTNPDACLQSKGHRGIACEGSVIVLAVALAVCPSKDEEQD